MDPSGPDLGTSPVERLHRRPEYVGGKVRVSFQR